VKRGEGRSEPFSSFFSGIYLDSNMRKLRYILRKRVIFALVASGLLCFSAGVLYGKPSQEEPQVYHAVMTFTITN
jgi:hypothetical protein